MKRAFHSFPAPSFFPNRFIFFDGPSARARGKKRIGTRERDGGRATRGRGRTHVHAQRNRNVALLPFSKTGRGNTRALRPFSEGRNAQKSAPLSGDRGAHKAFGLVRNAGQEASRDLCPLTEKSLFPPPEPFGNRPGTSPRPGVRKNTSGLSFPHPDGTRPRSTVPACAVARHLPERTRRTTTDDMRRVRTRLNAGRPNAAVCLYRHARRPIFFPAARKARADTAPR